MCTESIRIDPALRIGLAILLMTALVFHPESQATAESKSIKSKPVTSWSSFRNDNRQLGITTEELPADLQLIWKHEMTDGVTATAAISGGRVYVAGFNGEVQCLDLKTARVYWTYHSAKKKKPGDFIPGFKSSPAVTTDSVFIGDENGALHAIDLKTGKQKWVFATTAEIISSPNVTKGKVLFGSYDNSLYCLNATTGKELWHFETSGYVHCSPAIADNVTFVTGCDEHLRVIDIDTGKQINDIELGMYLIASPAVFGETLYVGNYAAEVLAIDWKKADTLWTYKSGKRELPFHSSAAVSDKLVVVGGRDKLIHGIDRVQGKSIWTFATRSRVDSSPVIAGSSVFVGSNDENIYRLQLKDGKQTWKFKTVGAVTASPAIAEGHLVIGCEGAKGVLYCFGAGSK